MAALSMKFDSAVIWSKTLLQRKMTAQSFRRTVRGLRRSGLPVAHGSEAVAMPWSVVIALETAGWLCACSGEDPQRPADGAVRIQRVQAPDILGVGEGTFPSISGALSQIGIGGARFIRETRPPFKQGIRFVDGSARRVRRAEITTSICGSTGLIRPLVGCSARPAQACTHRCGDSADRGRRWPRPPILCCMRA